MGDDIVYEWWRQTSGPRRLMHKLTTNAMVGCCCATDIHPDEDFFDVFRDIVLSEDSAVIIEREDVAEGTGDEDFLHGLLSRYAAPDYEIDLLSESPFEDMAVKCALEHRIIFVTLRGRCQWAAKAGAAFNRGVTKSAGSHGVLIFLPEYLDEDFISGCGVEKLRSLDYISLYDAQALAGHFLAERGMMDGDKRLYTSGLAAKLTSPADNCELTAQFAVPQLYRDPVGTARRIMGENFSEEQCQRSIWEMQIQTVLPILENVRQLLIKNYESKLTQILTVPVEDDFGNILNEPLDMELRHLRFYGASEKFFKPSDWELLMFVCDVRNRLAHLKSLPTDELDKIFYLT